MKTLHTIYTNFAKRIAVVLTLLLALGVTSAWGQVATLPVYYSFEDGKSSLPNGVTHKGLSSDYAESNAPYRLKFDGTDDYIQVQVNGAVGKIKFGVKMIGGGSTSYFQIQGSADGNTYTNVGDKFQISGEQDDIVNCTTTGSIDQSYRYFRFVFEKGSNVGFGVLQMLEPNGDACDVTYDFREINFLGWTNSYAKHVIEYEDATVTFASASKQTVTITDQPVTKGNEVSLVMTDGSTLSAIEWTCTKWSSNSQTITLHYSTNGGQSYTTTGVTSSNFTISSDNLPVGTNAVKITFSSSSNQVGITSCSIEKVCGPIEVTVTLNPNGGTGDFDGWDEVDGNYTKTVEKDNSVTLPDNLEKTGYTFQGWSDGENTYTGQYAPTANVTLTASWKAIDYAITYNLNGGTNHASNPENYTIETSTITLQAPTKTGYTFDRWYKEDAFKNPVTQITNGSTGDITLYAKWTINSYSTRWKLAGGQLNGNSDDIVQDYEFGQAITAPTGIERVGFSFIDWEPTVPTTMPAENLEFTAQWQAKPLTNYRTLCTYEITYEETYGVVHSNPDTYTAANLPLTFEAPTSTREGYTFKGWNPATLSAETRGDKVIEAQWTVNQYTVTWKLNGGQWQGGGTEDRVNNHNYGAEVTIPVNPSRTGYTFTGWSHAEIPATMPAENLEFTAQWTPTPYTVIWKLGEENYHTSNVDIENSLSIAPDNPSDEALGCCADKFMGWSSQQSPSAGNIFTKDNIPSNVTTDKIYYAVFATTAQGVGTSIADFSQMGYENNTAVTTPIILGDGEGHGDATITLAKAQSSSNAPTYYTDGEAVRIYAGGTITIASSYNIKNVTFTFATGDGTNEITAHAGTYADGVWTENIESPTNNLILTIGGEAGQHRRIASIQVTTGVSGSQYTNYVTQCTALPNPALSGGSVPAIAVNCGDFSTLNNSQAITFSTMQDLTCPVTFEVIDGDFLISTAKDRAAQYQSKITVTPTKSGENIGKLKNVYVRANATNHNTDFTGRLKVTSDEIADDVIITLTTTVTCEAFTLTTKNHLGTETVVGDYFAGVVINTEPTPSSDACTAGYTFDGWSTDPVEYGSVAYSKVTFPYTMPNHDVTLYPVYRINDTEDYHRVTSNLGANNWAGDYLIAANDDQQFAMGKKGGTTDISCIGGTNSEVTTMTQYIVNNAISSTYGDPIHITLVAVENGYVLQTQDSKYNYITDGATSAGISTNTDIMYASINNHPLTITFNNESDIVITNPANTNGFALKRSTSSKSFRFLNSGDPIYLYRKSPLYTSSLICEEITAENAMVTSTADQTVKVNVTATMSNTTVNRTRTLTVESDNTDFTATITETATNTYNVAVSYTPSAEDNTDGTETATITIKVNNIPVTTFQVTGRHLPENFVIAAKWGDNWYALPANCVNSGDSKQGILIDVNDINNPTSATAPTTTKYGLRGVKPGRQTEYGQSILLTERVSGNQKALYQNSGETENIWVSARYENYDGSNPTYYEWIPTTNDLTNYTFTHSASSRKLGVNENGVFGAYTTDVQVRLLPATFYDQVAVQVIKWKANSVIVMYTGAATTATTQVGTYAATAAQTLANQKITHGIYELTTTQSLTANAGKILTMCFGTAQVKIEIPLIVNGTTTASKNGHDVVILDGGKLTASTTPYSYKNVYVYGGGKLAIPTGTQLGVKNIILRAGGVATDGAGQEATYQYIYPQVELKGTLSTPTNASGFMKYEYVTDYDHWYHLVLPFDAQYNTITYPQEYYGDNVTSNNTGSWQIKRYAGEIRATGNYDAWVDIETENANTVTAGKGYIYWAAPKKVTVNGSKERQKWGIQRITLGKTPSVAITEENSNKKISSLSSYAAIQGNSGKDNDQGWNLIGNPYMMNLSDMDETGLQVGKLVEEEVNGKWTGQWEWLNDDLRYLTIPSDHFDTYTAKTISAATPLVAGRAFFVQLAGDANAMTFEAANRPNLMPALRATTQIEKDIETGIILSSETMQDEMNFWIKDGKTNEYEYNADYPKTPNNNRFNIYGVHTNGDLSWVAISPELAAESMPIGYQVPAAGTYMLSLSETYYSDDLQALYVIDHAMSPEITVDLMTNNYYFDVNQAETNDTRFTVSLQVKSSGNGGVTTDNENIDVDKNQPIKFIYQDKLYILRNGVIYDGTGKQVKTINK